MAAKRLADIKDKDQSIFRQYDETSTTTGNGDWILLYDPTIHGKTITVGVEPSTSSSSYIEFTTDSEDDVIAGTATGRIWKLGTVATATEGYFPAGITAVRQVTVSGTSKLTINAL